MLVDKDIPVNCVRTINIIFKLWGGGQIEPQFISVSHNLQLLFTAKHDASV